MNCFSICFDFCLNTPLLRKIDTVYITAQNVRQNNKSNKSNPSNIFVIVNRQGPITLHTLTWKFEKATAVSDRKPQMITVKYILNYRQSFS